MEKGDWLLLITFIVGLIVIGLAAGYFLMQKYPIAERAVNNAEVEVLTNETADWNTYTNAEYGFGFNYPGNWTVISSELNSGYLEIRPIVLSEATGFGYGLFLEITKNSLQELVKVTNFNSDNFEKENVVIDDIKGLKFTEIKCEGKCLTLNSINWLVEKGNLVYRFNAYVPNIVVSEKILSTFKFTK